MTDGKGRGIAVIIPTLNERSTLPENLDSLLSDEFSRIVVCDGGSTDGTVEYVEGLVSSPGDNRLRLLSSNPGRGTQMNAGAAVVDCEWLVFHHADSLLPAGAASAITQLPDTIGWGGFRHSFKPTNWKLRTISALHNARCRKSGVVYGDQSMFVRQSLFEETGRFPEEALEDLKLSDQLIANSGKSYLLPLTVQTDSRKFLQIGEFRAFWQVVLIVSRFEASRRVGNDSFFLPYR